MGDATAVPGQGGITRQAQYSCEAQLNREKGYYDVRRDVTIGKIDNEAPEKTLERFEKAAKDLAGTIIGCRKSEFAGFVKPATDGVEPKAAEKKEAPKREEPAKNDKASLYTCAESFMGKYFCYKVGR